MRKLMCGLMLVGAMVPAVGQAKRAPQELVDPPAIPVAAEITQDQARRAIHAAADKHGWVISQESPGHSLASVTSGEHVVTVDIAYETRLISINYADSQNMDYGLRHNVRYIHPKYNKWTHTLWQDISEQIALAHKPPRLAVTPKKK